MNDIIEQLNDAIALKQEQLSRYQKGSTARGVQILTVEISLLTAAVQEIKRLRRWPPE